jgi:hypothetical protein
VAEAIGTQHLGARRRLLTEQIRQIFEESEQTYGSPRIFKELKLGRGMAIGEKRVARLMRQSWAGFDPRQEAQRLYGPRLTLLP